MSEEGLKDVEKEVKRREASFLEDVELRDDMKTGEIFKTRSIRENIMALEKRKAAFEAGEPFVEHSLNSSADAIALISAEEAKLNKIQQRIDALQDQIDDIHQNLAVSWSIKKVKACADIIQKYVSYPVSHGVSVMCCSVRC
jgi:uncharacterized protein YaaR (DUF327 family)